MGSEGGTLVRRRTLKESLRRSFRRLRSGRRSGRRRQSTRSGKDPGQQSPSGEEAPVQRLIDESIKVGEGYQGLVRCLYMVDTFLKDGKETFSHKISCFCFVFPMSDTPCSPHLVPALPPPCFLPSFLFLPSSSPRAISLAPLTSFLLPIFIPIHPIVFLLFPKSCPTLSSPRNNPIHCLLQACITVLRYGWVQILVTYIPIR